MPLVPAFTQVLPSRIGRHNQRNFLYPKPTFDLLFTPDGTMHIFESLVIDQPVQLVSSCECGCLTALVLRNATHQAVRHTRVQGFRPIGHDINEIRFRRNQVHRSFASLRMTEFKGPSNYTSSSSLIPSAILTISDTGATTIPFSRIISNVNPTTSRLRSRSSSTIAVSHAFTPRLTCIPAAICGKRAAKIIP